MPTVEYYYPRALELEGRHPADAGCWGVTINRLEVGEGLPRPESSWAVVTFSDNESIPQPRRAPQSELYRSFYYRRVRSSVECDRFMTLHPHNAVSAAFSLTSAWANPQKGLIPAPTDSDPPLPLTHAAVLIGCIPQRSLFHFRLKWKDWGDQGTGYMPYEYFDRYVFESWGYYRSQLGLRLFKLKNLAYPGGIRWSAHDTDDSRIYAFEVRDARREERLAWTFVVERDGTLEIEELYVRPEYRKQGHGKWLADCVTQLAREKGMPLRLWIGFADCRSENIDNYQALVAIAQRLGVQFQPSPAPWAAYFGTTEQPGANVPIEPTKVPNRPRTPRKELLAAVAALSIGYVEPNVHEQVLTVSPQMLNAKIAVGTPAWDALTERRAELIVKMHTPDQALTKDEHAEYEQLQKISRAAIDKAFPRPKLSLEDMTTIKSVLGIKDDLGK